MNKLNIYAILAARAIILLAGFILLPLFFLVYVISLISETYLTSLFSFVTSTKNFIARLKTVANEPS